MIGVCKIELPTYLTISALRHNQSIMFGRITVVLSDVFFLDISTWLFFRRELSPTKKSSHQQKNQVSKNQAKPPFPPFPFRGGFQLDIFFDGLDFFANCSIVGLTFWYSVTRCAFSYLVFHPYLERALSYLFSSCLTRARRTWQRYFWRCTCDQTIAEQ